VPYFSYPPLVKARRYGGGGDTIRTIVSIQALRALAALAVTACHYDEVRLILGGHAQDPSSLVALSAGVDLFFVISGFIMVYSSEQLFGQAGAAREFFSRRIARIVPLYWVTTGLAIWLMSRPYDVQSVLKSLFFIPYRIGEGTIIPLHGVGWTLNFEMFFYVLFAAVIGWPRKIAVPALSVALALIAAAGYMTQPMSAPLQFWSDPIVLEFVAGMLVALAYIHGIRLPGLLRVALVPAAIGVVFWVGEQHLPSGPRLLVWGVPAATIVACTVLGRRRDLPQWIAAPVKLLGDASYSMYLLHPLVSAVVVGLWSVWLNHYGPGRVMLVAAVAAQALSIATYKFLERPCMRAVLNGLRRVGARGLVARPAEVPMRNP
jgi:exopolysaccharide production protein ExoZ